MSENEEVPGDDLFVDLPERASESLRGHMGDPPGPHMQIDGAAPRRSAVFDDEDPGQDGEAELGADVVFASGPDGIPMPVSSTGVETDATRLNEMLFGADDERPDLTVCSRERCAHYMAQVVTIEGGDACHRVWKHLCTLTGIDITKAEIQACNQYRPRAEFATPRRLALAAMSPSAVIAKLEEVTRADSVVRTVVGPIGRALRKVAVGTNAVAAILSSLEYVIPTPEKKE